MGWGKKQCFYPDILLVPTADSQSSIINLASWKFICKPCSLGNWLNIVNGGGPFWQCHHLHGDSLFRNHTWKEKAGRLLRQIGSGHFLEGAFGRWGVFVLVACRWKFIGARSGIYARGIVNELMEKSWHGNCPCFSPSVTPDPGELQLAAGSLEIEQHWYILFVVSLLYSTSRCLWVQGIQACLWSQCVFSQENNNVFHFSSSKGILETKKDLL